MSEPSSGLVQRRWTVVYECSGVPYGRYYERFRWVARLKALWLTISDAAYYQNVRVVDSLSSDDAGPVKK